MSAQVFRKQYLFLGLVAVLAIATFISFMPSSPEAVVVDTSSDVSAERAVPVLATQFMPPEAVTVAPDAHPADCSHCNTANTNEDVIPRLLATRPDLDYIFKGIANQDDATAPRSTFNLKGSQKGQHVSLSINNLELSGIVTAVLEDPNASAYAIKLENNSGRLVVDVDGNDAFSGQVLFFGDSRALTIRDHQDQSNTPRLIVEETTISDLYCAPRGTIYTESGLHQAKKVGYEDPLAKVYAPLVGIAEAIPLDSLPGAEFVIYLDFDGEEVTDPRWNGGELIDAQPHPRANDDSFVTSVWRRAAEDFAPFDITVTTDVAIYDTADVDKRLHVVITPTNDAAPGAGGVAGLFSFRSNSPVVWVFNLSEYICATTISHEAGHAFGLYHDGQLPTVTYYPGHNDGYTPGWGAIMGAPFSGGFYDEVDQWSKGEYEGADNQEDDLAIIAGTRNGFGYKADDYSDVIGGGSGILNTIGEDLLGATGLISTSSDVDIFRFASVDGDITLTVSPLDVNSSESQPGSNTQGANLAAQITLLDSTGLLLATGLPDGATELESKVEATVTAGIYYIAVEGAGRGVDASVGFSDYASLGAYTIIGNLPAPPLTVTGGEGIHKNANSVLLGDVETQVENGTNYGFSYVANGPVVHTYHLTNTGTTEITNLSVTLGTGDDFYITNSPRTSIDGNATDFSLRIAYDPNDNSGKHTDTVIIRYDAAEVEVFEFTISGTSTKSATEDNYETNNNAFQAYNLNPVENTWLSDHRGEAFFKNYWDDFYTFNVDVGDLVSVEIDYDATAGPVTFELWNGYFNTPLRSTTNENGIIEFVVPTTFTNAQHLTFYIKASLPEDNRLAGMSYDLRWSSRSLLGVGGNDDFYEENDSMAVATDLGSASNMRLSEYLGVGISNDEDWYKVQIPANPYYRMLYIEATFVHSEGNIDIEVMNESGDLLVSNAYPVASNSDSDSEVVTVAKGILLQDYIDLDRIQPREVVGPLDADRLPLFNVPNVMGVEPGFYYVRVSGDFAGNSYDLLIEPRIEDNYEVVTINPTGGGAEELISNDSRSNPSFLGDQIIDQWLSDIKGPGTLAAYTSDPEEVSDLFDPRLDTSFEVFSDTDWYEFTIRPLASGERVGFIQIEYKSVGSPTPSPLFNHPLIKLEPESTTDGSNLSSEDMASDFMEPSANVGVLTLPVKNSYSSTYLISIEADHPHEYLTGYDFKVTLIPESSVNVADDNYEQNDHFQELFDLRNNGGLWLTAIDGYGVQIDPDWYEISVPEGAGQVAVLLTSDSSVGNVDLTLSKKDGNKLFESLGGGNTETIIWNDPIPGAYAVTVTGDRVGNQYNLFWDVVLEDDSYEENDERLEATDLSSADRTWLRKVDGPGVQGDEDWFKINVPVNTALLDIRTNFNPDAGDIDLELYNANGYLIERSISNDAIESLTLSSPASGDYYIQIHYGNAGNEYDLWWAAFTQEELDSVVEDAYEENDTLSAAHVLANDQVWLSALLGVATQTDDDWFVITLAEGNIGLDVDLTFTHADGDIDVEVYDALGSVITRSESLTDNESINYNAPLPDGNYLIRVFGANLANEYDLYWVDRNRDVFESNNTRQTAYDLSNYKQFYISQIGVPTQGDDDWYQIETLVDNSTIVVDLTFSHVNGDINLELYDSSGALITGSMTTEDFEYIQQEVPATGIYYVRVWGDNNHTDYDLFWNAQLEDSFEENDAFLPPVGIPNIGSAGLNAVAFDDDWFAITPPLGAVSVQVDLTFTHGAGNLDLEAYDNNGNLTNSSASADDNETLIIPVNPFGLPFYVRVFHPNRDYGNTYSLTWMSSTTDAYEGNNSIVDAFDLTATEGELLSNGIGFATSKDEDWYRIDVTGLNLAVYCSFSHAEGNIDIELYDVNGIFVSRSISESDDEFILQEGIAPGTYYIRVFRDLAGNVYDLIWNTYGADDLFEDNDETLSATDLTSTGEDVEYEMISDLVQVDEDWFQVEVENPGDRLIVECDFSGAGSTLELWLYGPVPLSTAVIDGDLARIDLSGLTVGPYFARVTGPNVGINYSLRWSSGSDDNYEDNDTLAGAYDYSRDAGVLLSGLSGLAYQYDEDWYRVEVATNGNTLITNLSSIVSEGVLSLKILDTLGNELAASSAGGDMTIFLNEQIAGTYFIQVSGPEMGTEYDLLWNDITDDNYEDNDTLADAYDLGSISGALSSIDGPGTRIDDDYYRIDSYTDAVRIQVDCSFTHADGDIALSILDQDGVRVGTVDSSDDDETLTVIILPDAATYYILVDGAQNSGASYDLSWNIDGIDGYEVNNTLVDAYDLGAEEGAFLSDVNGFGTQGDQDWYLVSLPDNPTDSVGNPVGPAGSLNVELTYTHANGDINFEVRDSAGVNVLASSNLSTGTESASVDVDDGNDYYIVVTGDNTGNSYDLVWSLIRDDNYEENDTLANAYDFSSDEGVDLSSISGSGVQLDEDWYRIVTPPGSVGVEVTLSGNIDLEMFDSTSTLVANAGATATGSAGAIRFLTDPLGGTYYFRVYGDDAGNTYDLTWSSTTVDAYEPNDFVEDATNLIFDSGIWLDQVDGYATQFQDDWYAIVVSDTSSNLNIQCQFTHASGDIDLELYQLVTSPTVERDDPSADERKPVLLARVTSSDDNELINFAVSEAGVYFIRAYFGNDGNAYNLLWDDGVDDAVGDTTYINDYLNGTWVYTPRYNLASALLDTPSANVDDDALTNWAEYALGLDPSAQDYVVVGQSITEIAGKNYFQFEFLRRKEAVVLGYEFIVEESSNMAFNGSTAVLVGAEDVDSEIERVFYRGSLPMDEQSQCFFRLVVNEPVAKE